MPLDQPWQDQLGGLEGGEALFARQAFAPATNLLAFGDQPGIDDLGVVGTAEGTVHGGRQQKNGKSMVAHPTGKTRQRLCGIQTVLLCRIRRCRSDRLFYSA
jgi:hypothetical protein